VFDRHDLRDEEWGRLRSLLPSNPGRGGRWADHRATINGVFWRARTGCPWRDMPAEYGNWVTVYKRHNRWSQDGTWAAILDRLRAGCDEAEGMDWTVGADSTVVRAHQDAAGARHDRTAEADTGGLGRMTRNPGPALRLWGDRVVGFPPRFIWSPTGDAGRSPG
jgi:transposase